MNWHGLNGIIFLGRSGISPIAAINGNFSQQWVNEYLARAGKNREEEWTHSIAVGSQPFVESVKKLLGIKAKGRKVVEGTKGNRLREEESPYQALFEVENSEIDHDNAYLWDINA